MQNVFTFRNSLIDEYSLFSRSFSKIAAPDLSSTVEEHYAAGRYWPEPLIQINPNYRSKDTLQPLIDDQVLHPRCLEIFQSGKQEGNPQPITLYAHQLEALAKAKEKRSYVVTTGTGSGKSLAFFLPIIDQILRAKEAGEPQRTRAVVIYPMNALANSQLEELGRFLHGYSTENQPFTVQRYTGQEKPITRQAIADNPPDILLTNFMMLELILTRYETIDRQVVENCRGLNFLVLDELHTYRGRQGADVAMLVRRLRQRLDATDLICVGTSATMSSAGTAEDQQLTVAEVASKLFGASISQHDVITETLERITDQGLDIQSIRPALPERIAQATYQWDTFEAFRKDPMAVWVELNLGIELHDLAKPKRAKPLTLSDAAQRLALDAGVDPQKAKEALQLFLASAHCLRTPQGASVFAFKLHQFISGPGKVFTTLEAENHRTITLDAQRFAPGRQNEGVMLYAAHFCRDCGQEYHPVWRAENSGFQHLPREIDDAAADEESSSFGFLAPARAGQQYQGNIEDLPDHWLNLAGAVPKVKSNYKPAVPQEVHLSPQGREQGGERFWFIPGKFRFCLNCGFVHETHGRDVNRLSSLSGEGRSSATTMLTLSALRQLFAQGEPSDNIPDPRKLLGFTDNRQDAALQAGHFNDFIFLLTLRAGLVGALQHHNNVLTEEHLASATFSALGFHRNDVSALAEYLKNPKLVGLALQEAQRTLQFILGYRLIRDLRKGWRFNNPNLAQLNLLAIDYQGLSDFCGNNQLFAAHPILGRLTPEGRAGLARCIFDELHRNLCLESRYLDPHEQDRAKNNAYNYLNERWSFAQDEELATSKYLILDSLPASRGRLRDYLVSGGPRSRFIRQLKQASFWKETKFAMHMTTLKGSELTDLLDSFLSIAQKYGYVQPQNVGCDLTGWRLKSSTLLWRFRPKEEETPTTGNAFFRQLYIDVAKILSEDYQPLFEFEAHEHTAQVEPARRMHLESRFRFTKKDQDDWNDDTGHEAPLQRLPVLFCSPTMELGVDISSLNTVYLRNVPPTPANYAQRSGRAGRSGQPALVLTYCAAQSPHDQWFFHHAADMVHGVVKPPNLDLANRDLVESHLHATWLAGVEHSLETSIKPLLNLDEPGKPIIQELHDRFMDKTVQQRALQHAQQVIAQVAPELTPQNAPWFTPHYVEEVVKTAPDAFDRALDRWRNLYEATEKQMALADTVVKNHTASSNERDNARRRYGDAARQLGLLLKTGNSQNTDFYTYRYLASQGFLPGYNFPRLPLMAWIPGRGNTASGDDDGNMVSRPRFLALSEFGPRSLIYHEGRTYRVIRAKLNVSAADHISADSTLATVSARVCSACGYGHMGDEEAPDPNANVCDSCGTRLTDDDRVNHLYRIETVETMPVERISVNDEERQRQGFELQTTYRFLPSSDGVTQKTEATVFSNNTPLATLTYSPAARIWRINRGWRRRRNKNQLGFYINPLSGVWSKQESPVEESGENADEEALLERAPNQRIVPFVEDHRNILILKPLRPLTLTAMATLQAALKRGVEQYFQIEEAELVVEPLPNFDNRLALLFYEAAEGGAGVLSRLATEEKVFADVARKALQLLHFNIPDTAITHESLDAAEERKEDGGRICEAGCYQCLLSYFNQPDHGNINRQDQDALTLLVALANGHVRAGNASPQGSTTPDGAADILAVWLNTLQARGLRQPDATSVTINNGAATADALYKQARTLVFFANPPEEIRLYAQERGHQLLVFPEDATTWPTIFAERPEIFGS